MKLDKLHCVQSVPRLTHSGASTLTIQSSYECLPCFHDLFTLSKGRGKTREVANSYYIEHRRILEFIYLIYYRTILTVGILIIILLILCNCFRM